ncbi:hypothetical protein LG337_09060 [Staphylococcus pseudoxylosus]
MRAIKLKGKMILHEYFNYLEQNPSMIPLFTGLFAFIGVMLSSILKIIFDFFINRRTVKADLVAKSRIEWIQEVRKLTAEFISISMKSFRLHTNIINASTVHQVNVAMTEYSNNYFELTKKYNLLRLYLPEVTYKKDKKIKPKNWFKRREKQKFPNDFNMKYMKVLNDVRSASRTLKQNASTHKTNSELKTKDKLSLKNANKDLAIFSAEYLKNEWQKAKSIK